MKGAERFRIGDYDCWTLADGELTYPGWTVLPPEGKPPAEMTAPYIALLVDTGSTRILIDTGAGALGPNTGKLPESLAATGFLPEDVHAVVLSHAHPDHVAGVQLFPNAAVVMMRKEFDFWMSAETQARLEACEIYGLGPLEAVMAASVRDHVAPARDRLRLLDRPAEIAAGILVFPAPGHTPGHAAVLVSSGRQQLLYVGDALFIRRSLNIRIGSPPSICLPRKRCARESSCWSGLWPTGVFSRAITCRAGWARSKRGRHRFRWEPAVAAEDWSA